MLNSEANTVCCFGCENKCTYSNWLTCRRRLSESQSQSPTTYCIWPATNTWLYLGVSTLIEKLSLHELRTVESKPVVFIDFSINNFEYFISDSWLWDFKDSTVIFITDSSMAPFANYWFDQMRTLEISGGIIYAEDTISQIIRKLISISSGNIIYPKNDMQRITINEFAILRLLYRGVSPKRMATFCQTSVNAIYANKSKIEKKFKCPIKRLPRAGML
ncbi:helix-turn-helix transcriptional regulator [Intestinirhabdus alba]|jgi:DNA-binding CsgD family transcriptional regulator|uniref:LuxR family transcriptional regulator n=1 Tax=Intestinirhabdus alba TaxID=2899544 RepID=A0A6L6ISC3_9ENTR|nr:helix-turn-helix transcriptional regulator [Intestinirhabdus alba]MTH48847.1 hypothetical protein [Intestinirhabdus alba]